MRQTVEVRGPGFYAAERDTELTYAEARRQHEELGLLVRAAYAMDTETRLRMLELEADLGAPAISRAFTGPTTKIRAGVALVRALVEEHGTGAIQQLEGLASCAGDDESRLNFARAAMALAAADPHQIRGVSIAHYRRGLPAPDPAAAPTRRRRR